MRSDHARHPPSHLPRHRLRRCAGLFFAATLAACGRDEPPPPAPGEAAQAAPAEPQPAVLPPSTETAVSRVESVMVTRPQDAPETVLIQAAGMVEGEGWTQTRLVPLANGETAKTWSFSLVARTPASGDVPRGQEVVEAELKLDRIPAGVEMIRVVASTNEVSAFLP